MLTTFRQKHWQKTQLWGLYETSGRFKFEGGDANLGSNTIPNQILQTTGPAQSLTYVKNCALRVNWIARHCFFYGEFEFGP